MTVNTIIKYTIRLNTGIRLVNYAIGNHRFLIHNKTIQKGSSFHL